MEILIWDYASQDLGNMRFSLPGFLLDQAVEASELSWKIKSGKYVCVVIFIKEIDRSWMEIIQGMKDLNRRPGLIIVSEKESISDRIQALRTGADDFMTMPYDVLELAARVAALTRRVRPVDAENLVFKEIRIDIAAKEAFVRDRKLDLTKKELELLSYFIEHKNAVISKVQLMMHLSGSVCYTPGMHDTLYAHIKNLKKKLLQSGSKYYLTSLYGIGYRWEDI